jgi:anti-sigma factor RsiW
MSELKCEEFVELVTDFLDGALDSDTERRFVDHLAGCDGCDRYLDQMRETTRTLGSLPPETLSDEARDSLLSAFRDWKR